METSSVLSLTLMGTTKCHSGDINSCDVSQSGLVGTGGVDRAVKLWQLEPTGGTAVLTAGLPLAGPGHSYGVNQVRFSPHGTVLASTSTDGTTVLWSVRDGQRLATLHQPSGFSVRALAFCPGSGGLLATGGDDNAVVLWSIAQARPLRTIASHEGTVFALGFSPDGAGLVTSDSLGCLCAWSAQPNHQALLASVEDAHDLGVTGLDFSSEFSQSALSCEYSLATCGNDGLLKQWCVTVGASNSLVCQNVVFAHDNAAMCARYSGHGQLIVTSGGDKICKVWTASRLECVTILDGFTRYVTSCCFSNRDAFILATSAREVKVWQVRNDSSPDLTTENNILIAIRPEVANEEHLQVRQNEGKKTQALLYKIVPSLSGVTACDVHNSWIATASGGEDTQLWECGEEGYTEAAVSPLEGHQSPVYVLRFSPTGLLVSAALAGDLILWDPTDGSVKRRIHNMCQLGIRSLQISANERFICFGGNDDIAHFLHLASGSYQTLKDHENTILAVDFSGNEQWLATGCAGGRLSIWHLSAENQSPTKAFSHQDAHDLGVNSCAFHTDLELITLATGGNDSLVNIWMIESKQLTRRKQLAGHGGPVMCVRYASDGRLMASASGDKSARIWDSRSYRCLAILDQHHRYVSSCAFSSPDSRLFATVSENSVSVWKLDLEGQQMDSSPLLIPISDWTGEKSKYFFVLFFFDTGTYVDFFL